MIKQALIMAAGYGRRMQPFTNTKPKPLAEINNKTLIAHIIEKLYNYKVENIVINTHYLSDLIIEHVKSLPLYKKLNILFSIESELLETGGGTVKATEYFDDSPFFRLNSDIFWNDSEESILLLLERNWNDNLEGLLLLLKKELYMHYDYNCDFNLIDNKIKKPLNIKDADLIFSGISIFSKSLFNNQKKEYFKLFQDFIFKKKMDKNNILNNINGIEYKDKIYAIDTIDSFLKTKAILG